MANNIKRKDDDYLKRLAEKISKETGSAASRSAASASDAAQNVIKRQSVGDIRNNLIKQQNRHNYAAQQADMTAARQNMARATLGATVNTYASRAGNNAVQQTLADLRKPKEQTRKAKQDAAAAEAQADLDLRTSVINLDKDRASMRTGEYDNENVLRAGYANYVTDDYLKYVNDMIAQSEAANAGAGIQDEAHRRRLDWVQKNFGNTNPSVADMLELDVILNGGDIDSAQVAYNLDTAAEDARLRAQYDNVMSQISTEEGADAWLRGMAENDTTTLADMDAKAAAQKQLYAWKDYIGGEIDTRAAYNSHAESDLLAGIRGSETYDQDRVFVQPEPAAYNIYANGIDQMYLYVNDMGFRAEYDNKEEQYGNESDFSMKGLQFMDETEIADFNAAYAQSPETAQRYLDSLMATGALNRRRAIYLTTKDIQFAEEHPVLATGKAALVNLANTMSLQPVLQGIGILAGNTDANSAIYDAERTTQALRGKVGEMAGEWWDTPVLGTTAGQLFYGGGNAIIDNLLSLGVARFAGGGYSPKTISGVQQLIQGNQVMGNTFYTELQSGGSPAGALMKGLASAFAAAATEKLSMDQILSDPTNAFMYGMRTVLGESAEEGLENLASIPIDAVVKAITGDKTELDRQYDQLIVQGVDPKTASKAVMINFAQGLASDVLIGGVVGGVSGAPNIVSTHITGGQMQQTGLSDQLLEIAGHMPEDSKSRRMADSVSRTGSKVGTVQLYNTLSEELPRASRDTLDSITVSQISRQLKSAGETGDTEALARNMLKLGRGETLNADEYAALAESKHGLAELTRLTETSTEDRANLKQYNEAYNAGYYGREASEGMNKSYYQAGVEAAQRAEQKRLARVGKVGIGSGKVSYIGSAMSNADLKTTNAVALDANTFARLEPAQRHAVDALTRISQATGMNFALYEGTADDSGSITVANGKFDHKTNTIYLDLNSGKNSAGQSVVNYAVLRTASHEMTHFIEQNSAEGYAALKNFLTGELAKRGKSIDKLVAQKIAAAERQGEALTQAAATAEVVADACEMMLKDTTAIKRLASENKSLAGKLRDFLRKLGNRIRKALEGVDAEHEEARVLREAGHYIDGLQKLWDDALVEAVQTARSVEETPEEALADVNVQLDTDTESAAPMSMSLRTWSESEYVANREQAAAELAKALGVTEAKAAKWIDDVNGIAKMVADDRERLDYEANEYSTAIKSNTEYGGSVDFSTICAKRRLQTGTMDAIQRALPDAVFTQNDIFRIRNMMLDDNLEVSCGLCYVESARKDFGRYAKAFLDEYAQTNPEWMPDMADVNTVDGLADMRQEHPEAYAAYEKYMNRLAQRKPKLYEKRTEYRNEILNKFRGDETVEKKNRAGGFRIQSFSDFEAVHLLDMMQVVLDMSNVGLAAQAYTKVPDFAWAMGDTGVKINLSMIAKGVDSDGRIIYDEREGMKYNDAKALRDRYSANVGTILVVFSDKQLKAALNDDFVDFIIPFHRSQWNKKNYAALGLPTDTRDFTSQQNERYIRPHYNERGKKIRPTNYAPNAYWDFSKTGKENAETYLRMCAEDGRRPKFAKLLVNNGDGSYSLQPDGSTDGYWKLLIDFKMYDNAGNGSPQLPVQPNFNMTEAGRILKNYTGGHASFPVAHHIVDKFVNEYRKNRSLSDSDTMSLVPRDEEAQFSRRSTTKDPKYQKLTKKQYETYGWVRANEIMSWKAYNKLTSMYSSVSRKQATAPRTPDGYFVPWTGNEFGVNQYLALMKGSISYPVIEQIYEIRFDNETSIDYIRECLLNEIKDLGTIPGGAFYYFDAAGVAGIYKREDSPSYSEYIARYERETRHGISQPRKEWHFGDGDVEDTEVTDSYSLRDLNADELTDEYLANLTPADMDTEADRLFLQRYQTRRAAWLKQQKELKAMEQRLQEGEESGFYKGDTLIMQQNRVKIQRDRVARAKADLDKHLQNPGMRKLYNASAEFVRENIMGKSDEEIVQLNADTEAEVKRQSELVDDSDASLVAARKKLRQLKSKSAKQLSNLREEKNLAVMSANKIRHIRRAVKTLHDKRVHETDYRNIPEDLKAFVGEVVKIFGDKYGTMVFTQKQADAVHSLYSKLNQKDGPYAEIAPFFDPDMEATLLSLTEWAKEYEAVATGKGMSRLENARRRYLMNEALADLVDHVTAIVRNSTNMFNAGRKLKFAQLSADVKNEMMEREDKEVLLGKPGEALDWIDNLVRTGNITPVYFFEQMGNEAMLNLFRDFQQGQEGYAFELKAAQRAIQRIKNQYSYESWKEDPELVMTTSQGHSITMTKEQAMWLYATWKREHSNTIANTEHLTHGGFVYEENADPTGKKFGLRTGRKNTTGHQILPKDMEQVEAYLTQEQKDYADAMVGYLSGPMAEIGNRVSMEMFGIRKYKEKYYFPYKTASDQLYQSSLTGSTTTTDDSRMKHSSFTHALTKHARTALVMGDFTQTVENHIGQMVTYSNFVLPIENMNRVLNHRFETDDGGTSTIRSLIREKYGTNTLKYIETFLHDMNGGLRTDNRTNIGKLVGLHKKAMVAASLSVALQQPSSILRAAAMINPKYIMSAVGSKLDYEQLMQHSGVAIIKQMGRFDTNVGKSTVEWLDESDTKYTYWEMAKQALNPKEWEQFKARWSAITTGLPTKMDEWSWSLLWNAVKREQAAQHPGMDTESDAFLDMCGERFNDVVEHTQVYDSVLSRSQIMRSKSDVDKMITSFMSEPTLTMNILYNAFRNVNQPGGKQKLVGAVASVMASSLAAAIGSALISAWNKDDDDRTALEKLLNKTQTAFVDNINPLNNLPWISDLWSRLQGYEVERADMSLFSDIVSAMQKVTSDNYTGWRKVEELGGAVANLFGVPAKNIIRDMRRIYNAATSDWSAPTEAGLKAALIPYYDDSVTAFYDRYTAAMRNGNTEQAADIAEYLKTVKGKDDDAIRTGVRASVKKQYIAGNMTADEGTAILTGAFPDNYNANNLYWTFDEWDAERNGELEEGQNYSKYLDLYAAIDSGTNVKAEAKRLLDTGVKKSTIADAITDKYKPVLIELYSTDKTAAAQLQSQLLAAYEILGYDRASKLKDIQKWYK